MRDPAPRRIPRGARRGTNRDRLWNPGRTPGPVSIELRRLGQSIRGLFRGSRHTEVDGVTYRELRGGSLSRALSKRGPGFKDYRVRFPSGASMRIRATKRREFADLATPTRTAVLQTACGLISPGVRALVLGGGTGHAAALVGEAVGPSGAIVSLESDWQAAQYAARRYPLGHVAHEHGWIESLAGELDGAFDAVLAVASIRSTEDPDRVLRELWRVTAPGGWLLVATPRPPSGGPQAGNAGWEGLWKVPQGDLLDRLEAAAGLSRADRRAATEPTAEGFSVALLTRDRPE